MGPEAALSVAPAAPVWVVVPSEKTADLKYTCVRLVYLHSPTANPAPDTDDEFRKSKKNCSVSVKVEVLKTYASTVHAVALMFVIGVEKDKASVLPVNL